MSNQVMGYQAVARLQAHGSREIAGGITVAPEALRFESDGSSIAIPMDRLAVGLDARRRVTFTDPAQPGLALHTHEDRILHHPVLKKEDRLQAQREAIERTLQRRTFVRLAGLLISGLLAFLLLFWWVATLLVGVLVERIPVSWEVQLGQLAFQQIKAQAKLVDNPVWNRQLEAISQRLQTALPGPRYTYHIQVIDHPDANAFALPGGIVAFHSGFLEAAGSPEEMAGVLAHEMAHVELRHALRRMLKSSAPRFLLRILIGDQQGFLTLAGRSTELLLTQSYSRDFEREADRAAWQYLLAANIDPRGLITFMEKLAANPRVSRAEKTSLQWLNSHPATAERLDYLRALWEQSPRKNGFKAIETSTRLPE